MQMPEINDATIALIKDFEGLRLQAYRDAVGVLTIGYGLTNGALPDVKIHPGQEITEAQAEKWLRETLELFARKIWPAFTRPPNSDQFGAMLSLAYNIGWPRFRKSTALKRFNAGDPEGAAEAMLWWNKAGGRVLRGLVRRRTAEAALFTGHAEDPETKPDAMREVPAESTTLQASAIGAASTVTGGVAAVGALDGTAQIVVVGVVVVALLAFAWIARERLKKWARGVR